MRFQNKEYVLILRQDDVASDAESKFTEDFLDITGKEPLDFERVALRDDSKEYTIIYKYDIWLLIYSADIPAELYAEKGAL